MSPGQRASASAAPATSALRALLKPASIAVVGASADRAKLAGRSLPNLINYGYRGEIWPVNPGAETLFGLRCYRSLDALPGVPETAVVVTPADAVPAALESLGALGCRSATVVAAGMEAPLGQIHPLWAACQRAIERHGIRVMGPNSIGLINAWDRIVQRAAISLPRTLRPGPLSVIAQSGAVSLMVLHAMHVRGLGCGFCVPVGNEGDLGMADLLSALVDDGRTRVFLLFLEAIRAPGALAAAISSARAAGEMVVVCLAGASSRGQSVAASHTGAVASPRHLAEAFLTEAGAIVVESVEQLLDVGALLEGGWQPRPEAGLGVLCLSGGEAALTADLCERSGAPLAELSPATAERIPQIIRFGAPTNPLDATADVLTFPNKMGELADLIASDPAIDLTCISLAPVRAEDSAGLQAAFQARGTLERPDVVLARWPVADEEPDSAQMRPRVSSCAGLISAYALLKRWFRCTAPTGSASGVTGAAHAAPPAPPAGVALLADAWVRRAGVPWVKEAFAHNLEELQALAPGLTFPVAVKALIDGLTHKSDWGGVELNVRDATALAAVGQRLLARAADVAGQRAVRGLAIQQMVDGRELLLGGLRDPQLGPFLVIGPGGLLAEHFGGQLFLPAPLDAVTIAARLARADFAWLLAPHRGLAAADVPALAEAAAAFGRHFTDSPEVLEVEINPLIVGEAGQGVVGVDARLVVVTGWGDAQQ